MQLIFIVKLMEDIPLCYGSIERIIKFQTNTNYILIRIRRLHVFGYIIISPSGLLYKTIIYHCISLLSVLYNRPFDGLVN